MSEYVFKLPDLGDGTVESEIAEWNVNVGDQVAEEAIVGTMMTDKAAIELNSPVSGRVISLAGEPGDIIAVGAPLIVFETDSEFPSEQPVGAASGHDQEVAVDQPVGAASSRDQEVAADQPVGAASSRDREVAADQTVGAASSRDQAITAVKETQPAGDNHKVITSPAIRRRAKEAGVDLSAVIGSGAGGRILRMDFDRFLKARRSGKAPAAAAPKRTKTTEVKVIGLRRVIAERMSEVNREIPHFSYVEEIDVTELESLRQHMNSAKSDNSERLTLLPFLGLALVRALHEFPQCNTTYDKERNVLLRHEAVHLGIATQTPDGLKVPVVRNAESRSIDDFAAEIRRVSEAARNNSARKEELGGSTITITSLGKLGGIASTPVINSPEVGIIGVNKAVERPVVVNGQVVVRLMMNLSSSFDHRFVDGFDAAAMIQRVKGMLEHPATIFIA
jgi:2-oxoisovalerate dehydrogenase E2 component (dihydrolipoyl transacylase)